MSSFAFDLRSGLLPLVFAFAGAFPLHGQSLPADNPHYYEGVPYGFLANNDLRAGTFYYNDFNRYQIDYTAAGGGSVSNYYFGSATAKGDFKDFNGQAIIGQSRGQVSTASGSLDYQRWGNASTVAGIMKSTPGNSADPRVTVSAPGILPTGTNHTLNATNNSLGVHDAAEGGAATFAISTAGYADIQLSFDLGLGATSSANLLFRASADGGATWTYEMAVYGLSGLMWFNGVEVGGNPNPAPFFDLSSHAEFNDNASFVFQMIGIPNEGGSWDGVDGSNSPDSNAYSLDLYIDRFALSGSALSIPEPAAVAAVLGLLALGLAWYRRKNA